METLARLANLPGALPGACAQGLIWGIMAIGVYLTYRILDWFALPMIFRLME